MNNVKKTILIAFLSTQAAYVMSVIEEIISASAPTDEADIVDYFQSGKFNETVAQLTESAFAKILTIQPLPEGATVIFDIDDTAISNSEFSEKCKRTRQQFVSAFREYVLSANAPVIPEVLDFYKKIMALGIKVIFISYRHEKYIEPTAKVLELCGYSDYHKLILRTDSEASLSASKFKQEWRKQLVQDGHVIIATIGDQDSDLEGDNTGIKIKLPCYYASSNQKIKKLIAKGII